MTVDEIAQHAANAPMGSYIRQLIENRGVSITAFLREVYGTDERGKPKNSGKLYPVLSGQNRITDKMITELAPHLGVSAEEITSYRDSLPEPKVERMPAVKKPKPKLPPPPPPPAPAPPEPAQFSMVVNQAGRATLTLNMTDVPLDVAMAAMNALNSAGLLIARDAEEV